MILANLTAGLLLVPQAPSSPGHSFLTALTVPAERGDLDLILMCNPQATWPARHLRLTARPTVVLIGDDPGTPDGQGGPRAWRCADRIGRWSHGCMIHASGGLADHYRLIAETARMTGRAVLIETTPIHARAWHDIIGDKCPRLVVLPRPGDCHPRETVH